MGGEANWVDFGSAADAPRQYPYVCVLHADDDCALVALVAPDGTVILGFDGARPPHGEGQAPSSQSRRRALGEPQTGPRRIGTR